VVGREVEPEADVAHDLDQRAGAAAEGRTQFAREAAAVGVELLALRAALGPEFLIERRAGQDLARSLGERGQQVEGQRGRGKLARGQPARRPALRKL
jgi:hypothetical protein